MGLSHYPPSGNQNSTQFAFKFKGDTDASFLSGSSNLDFSDQFIEYLFLYFSFPFSSFQRSLIIWKLELNTLLHLIHLLQNF